jgi:dTDP-4-dehydrorhamnose 3,5-epimerase
VQTRELSIPDSYEVTPRQHRDDRGVFLEWYRFDRLEEATGRRLDVRQANTSVSKRGVVRGIHFADVPTGQAKFVTASKGAVIDFIVDIRVGSPTFGQWDSVVLDDVERKAVFLSEGLGHAFVALSDEATVSYLVSDTFNPAREHAINPLDADVALVFPESVGQIQLSPKDGEATSLRELESSGALPEWNQCRAFYRSLSQEGR